MPEETFFSEPSSKTAHNKNENDNWKKVVIVLIFFLMSFICIFCSSQSALWFIDRGQVEASSVSANRADYSQGPRIVVPPVDAKAIAAEKAKDDQDLENETIDPLVGGVLVPVLLPDRSTPAPPSPTVVALFLTPTPTFTPTSVPEPAAPSTNPTPVSLPPTVPPTPKPTSAPTDLLPTAIAPTVLPTTPPTVPPPTVPPTVPSPTVPPTEPPPTSTPIAPPPTDTPLPLVQFSGATYSVNEGDGSATIIVMLSSSPMQNVTVNYNSSNGSAIAGSDYTAVAGNLNFTSGQTSRTFTIPITNDNFDELDETVQLTLSNPTNAILGSVTSAVLIIADNETTPTVNFDQSNYSAAEEMGPVLVTAVLSNPSALTVTVNYATSNGTAIAGSDYNGAFGTLTFAPGQTIQTFNVPIIDDPMDEPNETVNLALTPPVNNAILGTPSSAALTIVDNDPRPNIRFDKSNYRVPEDGGPAIITTSLSEASGFTVTANYTTSNITAVAGSDYLTSTGTLIFTPGQTTLTFTVTITDDGANELDETALLTLGNPGNSTLGTPSNATLTIEDNDSSIIRFDQPNYAVLENAGSAIITTTLNPSSPITVTVDYDTTNLTATAGDDYTPASNTLTFPPGTTGLTFTVTILDDPHEEPDETALLKLRNVNGAILGLDTATLTITDDADVSTCNAGGAIPDPGEPDIGPPDGDFREVACNSAFIVDLGSTPIDTSAPDANFDFVYYELGQPDPPTDTTFIFLDWVVVEVAPDISGPWYQVFYWGNAITDTNTNIGQAGIGPATSPPPIIEKDNENVSTAFLYGTAPYTTGIAIDIDAVAPPGIYRYVRFYVPNGGDNDATQVDSIEILP